MEYLTCEDVSEDCSDILKNDSYYIVSGELVFSYGNENVE